MSMTFRRKWDFDQGNRIVDTNALRDDTEVRDLIGQIAALQGGASGPAGGALAGTFPNPSIAAGAVGSAELAAAVKDPIATLAGLRTLGTGAQQAAPGNHTHAAATITGLAAVATTGQAADVLGLAAVARSGSASDITTGTLPNSVLPPLAISETFPVASQAAMLALAAQKGDVAVRSDLNKSFILRLEPATTLANWQELLTPLDAVTSVAGKVGVVSLVKADITDLGTIGTAAAKNTPASGNAAAGEVVLGNDGRLSDARTPAAHKASHATGGSDVLLPADIGAASSTKGGAEKVGTVTGTAGAVTCDAATGSWFPLAPTAAVTGITISNLPASGTAATFTLEVTQGATAYAITLPTGTIYWLGGQPTQTANKKTVYTLCTRDAGASWIVSAGVTA